MIICSYCVKMCLFNKHDSRKHLKLKLLLQSHKNMPLVQPHLPSAIFVCGYIVNVVDYEIWSNYIRAKIG
jgi:hypothetical protein